MPLFLGAICGFLCFKTAQIALISETVKIGFDALLITLFLIFFIAIKLHKSYFAAVFCFLLGVGAGFDYGFISGDFPLISNDILDSLSVLNAFFIGFAFLLLIATYFIFNNSLKTLSKSVKLTILSVLILTLLAERGAFLLLSLMQNGAVATESWLLSVVAKTIHYGSFMPVYLSAILLLASMLNALKLPPKISRANPVAYRVVKSQRASLIQNLIISAFIAISVAGISLFYTQIASKPPQISEPTFIEPQNGEFIFDANIVMDGKLHRFAYISKDKKEVRFFLINRFKDKLAPVAVFDACAICGDMGYIKDGDNLICISCNVRIYLASVGKPGGCNPIPFEYKFDGKTIKISEQAIEAGAIYFSKTHEETK